MALYARPPAWPVSASYHSPYENKPTNYNLRDSERELFKLPKIKLRSESTGKAVDAIIEGDQRPMSPKHQQTIEATNMERAGETTVTTVQKPSLPSMSILGHKAQEDLRRNDLPAARTVPSQPLQPKPVNMSEHANAHTNPQPPVHQYSSQSMGSSTPANYVPHHSVQSKVNSIAAGARRPSPAEAKLDAIDRIQAQVDLNRATLESCTRDIAKIENSFRLLHADFSQMREAVRNDLLAIRQHGVHGAPAPQPERVDDQSLEVFSNTLSQVVSKVTEVDVLRVQFEVIKRKLQRLEQGHSSPIPMQSAYPPQHQRVASMQQRPSVPQPVHQLPSQARLPSQEPRLLPSQPTHPSPYAPEPAVNRPAEHEQTAAPGWNTVNAGVKRALPAGETSQGEAIGNPMGSPKRTKLAPLEPRYAYPTQASAAPAATQYERMDTDEAAGSHSYRPAESYPDATQPSSFVPYTQDGNPDDSWRPVSQRAVSGPAMTHTSPGRGRGRGRGGRPRKSMPLEPHIVGTPEWEKEGWSGSQVDADGYYRGGVAIRGHGGAPGAQMSPIHAMDPYGHTKRSRTKPIRNADGVLIRKDGRPDMRSQSSAANLRKVHAKKEEERQAGGAGAGPDDRETTSVAESPVSTDSHDVEPINTQERADHIMRQMFPKGMENERARLYTAQQYFPSDQSQAGTAASTPIQRTISESEAAGSVEPEKARDDTPQQHQEDATMKDAPGETAPVPSSTSVDGADAATAPAQAPAVSATQAPDVAAPTAPTASTVTVQAS